MTLSMKFLKRSPLLLVLLLSIVLTSCSFGSPREEQAEKSNTASFDLSRLLEVSSELDYRPTFRAISTEGIRIGDVITILGWSESGNLAYLRSPITEGYGAYILEMYIVDENLELLWRASSDSHWGDAKEMDYTLTSTQLSNVPNWKYKRSSTLRDILWLENEEKIKELLETYEIQSKIENSAGGYVRSFLSSTSIYDIEVQTEGLSTSIVQTDSKSGKAEVLLEIPMFDLDAFEEGHNPDSYGYPMSIEIQGYIDNPFNKKSYVILREEYRGWEGPPNPLRYRFVKISS